MMHGNCLTVVDSFTDNYFDGVLTSPPYNLGKNPRHRASDQSDSLLYSTSPFSDAVPQSEYLRNMVILFSKLQQKVKDTGTILWNMGMSTKNEGPLLPHRLIVAVSDYTDWTLGDCIYWNKGRAMPFQTSPNKCSPFIEPVYVFCRKSHIVDYHSEKPKGKIGKNGQQFYKPIPNGFTAPQGKSTQFNKATFSIEMASYLLNLYFPKNAKILDPFAGSGTTLLASQALGMDSVGIEIDEQQITMFRSGVRDTLDIYLILR